MTVAKRTLLQFSPPVPMSADPLQDPLLGSVIDHRYQVERRVGQGALGVVYAVRHTTLGKRFALKALRAELVAQLEVGQRFMQEARSAAAVEHSGRFETTDFGHLPSGQPYFVMEWLEGEALALRAEPAPRERPSLRLVRHDEPHQAGATLLDEAEPAAVVAVRPSWSKLLVGAAVVFVAGGAFGALLALHGKQRDPAALAPPAVVSSTAAEVANAAPRSPSVTSVTVPEMRADAAGSVLSATALDRGAPTVHAAAAGRPPSGGHSKSVAGKRAPARPGRSEIVDPWGR